jgi:hypothetical protein
MSYILLDELNVMLRYFDQGKVEGAEPVYVLKCLPNRWVKGEEGAWTEPRVEN